MGFKNTFIDANSACCSKQDENNNLILHTHEYSQKLNLPWVVTIVGSKYVACCSKYNKNSKYILYVNTYKILIHIRPLKLNLPWAVSNSTMHSKYLLPSSDSMQRNVTHTYTTISIKLDS
jgi:hypothetical protein